MSIRIAIAIAVVLTVAALTGEADAQSPSTDVLPQGAHYVEFDYASHMESVAEGGYKTFTAKFAEGVGRSMEIGMNIETASPVVPDQGLEIQPNLKWRFYENESTGVSASVGTVLYVPIARRAGTDTFVSVTGSVSKVILGATGTRVTAGAYALVGRDASLGARVRPLFGVAQPITRRIGFTTDWVAGANRFGFLSPAFSIALSPSTSITLGYAFGNEGRNNNQFGTAVGIAY